jgi:hypothetical protein
MRKRKFPMSAALPCAALAMLILPVCRGAACCAPNAGTSAVSLSAALVSPAAQELAPGNPSRVSPSFPAHRVKVWTNEDLIATRTPADIYVFEKEAQAAALEEEAFSRIASCFAFGQPEGNADETQKEIDALLLSIRDSEQAVAQSRRALNTAPENLKLRNQMELAQRVAELNHAREELWKLQEHLRELTDHPSTSNVVHSSATPAQ